ncbi:MULTISPECIES: 4'-phosphopantetheinyl transferase family protein [unclassified Rathayibacter]|uniref:4'-phosphopantetheinyl transferase family protein n=1 Tax=unclassified Rathayibacter TaxID=2609250 RepID=UPI00188D08AF|nr:MULTISPECIES: 4'-phosphopantetheinyl transferase superfamily protein [unclassified Rathayibacter]MBF4463156.1 4'-phosphopantetheinyl transferase superfamily protein [Rathayibacter sp. VKM Ac-2879]MBF4504607.1 4'-phosphopantetheinyl transferase superfamily protein [Rathayibacter sp. VKM Ac-2878]
MIAGPSLLAGLLPADAVGVGGAAGGIASPWPGEEHLVGPRIASSGSRHQSLEARAFARRALVLLGEEPCALPRSASGAPVWPAGVVGGLTHTEGYRAAVVARSRLHPGIGVDAERMRHLSADLVRTFARPRELQHLDRLREAGHPLASALPLALFAAKEAAFKAWFPATGIWLGVTSAEVSFRGTSAFEVVPLVEGGRPGFRIRGRWALRARLVLAVARLERSATAAPR